MKINIGGVNVEKVYSFYPKYWFKVDLKQINVFFLIKKIKFNVYTSDIKLHCMVFSELF